MRDRSSSTACCVSSSERREPAEEKRRDHHQGHQPDRAVRVVHVAPGLGLRRDQHREHGRVEDVLAGAEQGSLGHEATVLDAPAEPRRPL